MSEIGLEGQGVFTKNRAEELGYDVWEHFVVPPFYHLLDLQIARKPRLIIGGRGCGKTMLLRYLSHQTMFSRSRATIPDDALLHIGLYWRADTQFANAMVKREVPEDTWQAAFNHMAALVLGMEVLDSVRSIALSSSQLIKESDVERLDFTKIKAFDNFLPSLTWQLREDLEQRLWRFESWVNDVRKVEEPRFLPGRRFVLALIQTIQQQIPALSRTVFFVYLDEYENLCMYQQEIINTWLKHSEAPLIFNLAMKRNAFETRKTTGPESLSDIHDFRTHDLELYFSEEEKFRLFAAEILFLHLSRAGVANTPMCVGDLRDPLRLEDRRKGTYKKQVLEAAEAVFPDVSHAALAQSVFEDKALSQTLQTRIRSALKHRQSNVSWERFFRPSVPEASIVGPALLFRKNLDPAKIAEEMDELERGKANRFTGPTNWIHNNFIGCLLQLYAPHSRACPFYAGFRTFCELSRGSIRHFLELCDKSINRSLAGGRELGDVISADLQAEAARQASAAFLGEVKSFGPYGNQLHTFALRLGSLFALAHQRPTQSESEQSHFSIGGGSSDLIFDDTRFLREATKWSVLFEHKVTKQKQEHLPETTEYVLNPIYSPYFHISYRKKRRLELRGEDIICLIRGSYDEVSALLRRFSKGWSVEPSEMAPTLFSHLNRENDE